jgi:hypothetical protein
VKGKNEVKAFKFGRNLRILTPSDFGHNRHCDGDTAMQKHSRILAMFLLVAITVGCLRVCPPPQTLLSLDWNAGHCSSDRVVTEFHVGSTGLDFVVRRAERNLHVCVVMQESH